MNSFSGKFFLLIFALLSLSAAAEDSCELPFTKLDLISIDSAKVALNRSVTANEWNAILKARNVSKSSTFYTPAEVKKQDQLLMESGLKKADIRQLRLTNIIGNTITRNQIIGPIDMKVLDLELKEISTNTISAPGEHYYFVDADDHVFLMDKPIPQKIDQLFVIRDTKSPDSMHVVKEAGKMIVGKRNQIAFYPKYSLDVGEKEVDMVLAEVRAKTGIETISRIKNTSALQGRMLDCMDIMGKQSADVASFFDRWLADALWMTGGIIVTEAMGAHRLEDSRGLDVVAAGYVGGIANTFVSGAIAQHLIINEASLAKSLATRTGAGAAMIAVQMGVNSQMLGEDSQERTKNIALFDAGYFGMRVAQNHYFDKFVSDKLPTMLFDSCKRGSKMTIFFSPRMVRIYEKGFFTVLYYGGRSAIINE